MVEYGILAHGMMLGDRRRLDAYVRAIREVVRPGAVVVDIGSGTGVFAMVACQAGASRVYAIEAGDIIVVARELAAANGWASRIEFMQALSTDVVLPQLADVVVMDVRGVLPDEQRRVAADARRRFLTPDGAMIPARDTVWATLVSVQEIHDLAVGKWGTTVDGIDLRSAREVAAKGRYKARVKADQMLVEPQLVASFDYALAEPVEPFAPVRWTLERPAIAHGAAAWFDSVLAPGIAFSNRPGAPDILYGQAYFPWPQPVELAEGDTVEMDFVGRDDGQGDHVTVGRVAIQHRGPQSLTASVSGQAKHP